MEVKGSWVRERKRDPKKFSEFRTARSGSKTHLLIMGKLKDTDSWLVQSVLHPLSEKDGFCAKDLLLEEECERAY